MSETVFILCTALQLISSAAMIAALIIAAVERDKATRELRRYKRRAEAAGVLEFIELQPKKGKRGKK